MSTIINGTAAAVPQPDRYRLDPQRGWTVTKSWRGTKGYVQSLMPGIAAAGWAIDVFSQSGAVWELTATSSFADSDPNADSQVINDWSFLPGSAEKALLHADTPIINGLTSDEINAIQTSINSNDPNAPATTTPATGAGVALSVNAKKVWLLMKAGQTSIEINAPVIRHTRTVSNLYTIKAASTYAGQIMTSAQIISYEKPPASILVDIPDQTYSGILPLQYGWKKRYPEKTQTAYNRINLVQEWHYGLWETLTNVFAVIP